MKAFQDATCKFSVNNDHINNFKNRLELLNNTLAEIIDMALKFRLKTEKENLTMSHHEDDPLPESNLFFEFIQTSSSE